MRKGSNFVGTEEELEALMKDSLKHMVDNSEWILKMEESLSEQEYINICESLAECIDRGYLLNIGYNVLMNKKIMFHSTIIHGTITLVPKGTSDEELKEYYKSQENIDEEEKPYVLTQAGEKFLNS